MMMAVTLDHDYCATMISKEGGVANDEVESVPIAKETVPSSENESTSLVLSTNCSVSSTSPTHSSDSGVDNEFDAILAELGIHGEDFLDVDDLDRLLKDDDKASRENQTLGKPATGKTPLPQEGNPSSVLDPNTKRTVKNTTRKLVIHDDEEELFLIERDRKNVVYARENRKKKKKYVNDLEMEVSELRKENRILKEDAEEMQGKFSKLEEEITYMKNVLANQSTISRILKGVAAIPGISLSSSLVSCSRDQEPEQNEVELESNQKKYCTRSRKRAGNIERFDSCKRKKVAGRGSGGVCLHISQEKVSLELCSQCSTNAQQNG